MIDAVTSLLTECQAGRVASLLFVTIDHDGNVSSEIIEGSGDVFVLLGAVTFVQSQIVDLLSGDDPKEEEKPS